MNRLLLLFTIVAVAGLLFPAATPAHACSCLPRSTRGYVSAADAIVIGTVTRVFDTGDGVPGKNAVVSVETYLRGSGPAEIVAAGPAGSSACGYFTEASAGLQHMLFLSGLSSPFKTDLCAGDAALSEHISSADFVNEVKALTGPGIPPGQPPPSSQSDDGGFPWLPVALGTAGAAVLAGAGVLLLRRRARA